MIEYRALSVSMTGTAHAAEYTGRAACSTTGAHGDMSYSNHHGPDATAKIHFVLDDVLADGYGVRVARANSAGTIANSCIDR